MSLLSFRREYGLNSCRILPIVTGYVSIRVTCLMLRSSLIASNSRVYKNVSQLLMLITKLSSCSPGYENSGKNRPECRSWSSSLICRIVSQISRCASKSSIQWPSVQ